MENWWLKVAALFLAYVIWVLMRSGEVERVFTVPLIVQVPRNMEIVSEHPATVEVSTLGSDLSGTAPNLTYTIDLREEKEGEQTIDLTPVGLSISPASDLTVVHINPARVKLVMESVISREVPVRVSIQGKPDAGYEYYGAICRPDRILILGPRSQISPIREVTTDPVVLTGKNRSFQTTVNFGLQGDDIHTSPATAEVAVELGGHRNEQIVRVPVTLPDNGEYAARPAYVTVHLLVPATNRQKISAADFKATAIPNRRPGPEPTAVKPEVAFSRDLGAGVAIRQIDPEEVILLRKSGKR
jgi:YbbR domain-containing protein